MSSTLGKYLCSVFLFVGILAVSPFISRVTFAEGTPVVEKAKEVGRDVSKNAKKGARSLEDKTCEMVNGKMECAAKKIKHGAQNAVDEVKDKADGK